jgi:hypothetical protein
MRKRKKWERIGRRHRRLKSTLEGGTKGMRDTEIGWESLNSQWLENSPGKDTTRSGVNVWNSQSKRNEINEIRREEPFLKQEPNGLKRQRVQVRKFESTRVRELTWKKKGEWKNKEEREGNSYLFESGTAGMREETRSGENVWISQSNEGHSPEVWRESYQCEIRHKSERSKQCTCLL